MTDVSLPAFAASLPGVRRYGDGYRVAEATARQVVEATFLAAGSDAAEARRIAERLVGANLRGHDSHGVIRAPRYLDWIDSGRVLRNQHIRVETDTAALAIVDGQYGFGQVVARSVFKFGPWASSSVVVTRTSAPRMAITTASWPARIPGITKRIRTSALARSPSKDPNPCQRATASTSRTKRRPISSRARRDRDH